MSDLIRNRTLLGDAIARLHELPDKSVDMVLTSPPYFRLRDYGEPGQFGTEATIEGWTDHLEAVASEVQRVLVPTGSFWLNLGDTYSTNSRDGAPRKSLLLGPERLAERLICSGWLLRNKIVWAKANPMPSSVRDRLTSSWEIIYLLARQEHYFFDLDAVRVPHRTAAPRTRSARSGRREREPWRGTHGDDASGLAAMKAAGRIGHPLGKNPGDVWTIASSNYRGDHHATFPINLARRTILAGCPEMRCSRCLAPWRRSTIRAVGRQAVRGALGPTCDCNAPPERGIVLDPFMGAGTTALAAEQLDRDWIGIEINPDFVSLAAQRLGEARASPAA